MIWLFMPSTAAAFGGAYLGPSGAVLGNRESQVVIARQGNQTTLTVSPDYDGAEKAFTILMPVPRGTRAYDVGVVDPSLIDGLDRWSAARLISAECDDLWWPEAAQSDRPAGEFATLESHADFDASYVRSHYTIAVFDADQRDEMLTWLADGGATVGADAADAMALYDGLSFLAARVDLSTAPGEGTFLEPLQLRFDAAEVPLPIRMGTVNAGGWQDLELYVLSEGRAAVGSFPEVDVEQGCMVETRDDIGRFHEDQLETALLVEPSSWTTLFADWADQCTACPGQPLTPAKLAALGWEGSPPFVTRMHVRYASDIQSDLSFHVTRASAASQTRYVDWRPELQAYFPICGEGFVASESDCGELYDVTEPPVEGTDPGDEPLKAFGGFGCQDKGAGCAHAGATSGWLAALLVAGRRR